MRLALTGVHGAGKTTLLNALREHPRFAGMEFLPGISRYLLQQGFPINEAAGVDTQILILGAHMTNLLTKDNFISDRCIIDGCVYTQYHFKHNKEWPIEVISYANYLLENYVGRYDKIFYLPAEFKLQEDGVRSTDPKFQEEIQFLFEMNISALEGRYKNKIVRLTGSVEARVEQVVRSLP